MQPPSYNSLPLTPPQQQGQTPMQIPILSPGQHPYMVMPQQQHQQLPTATAGAPAAAAQGIPMGLPAAAAVPGQPPMVALQQAPPGLTQFMPPAMPQMVPVPQLAQSGGSGGHSFSSSMASSGLMTDPNISSHSQSSAAPPLAFLQVAPPPPGALPQGTPMQASLSSAASFGYTGSTTNSAAGLSGSMEAKTPPAGASSNQPAPYNPHTRVHQAPVQPEVDPNDKGPKQLIVNYLAPCVKESELFALFEQFGPCECAKIVLDKETGATKGFGFVYFASSKHAATAMKYLQGFEFYGKYLRVGYAVPQRPPPVGGYKRLPQPTDVTDTTPATTASPVPQVATPQASPKPEGQAQPSLRDKLAEEIDGADDES